MTTTMNISHIHNLAQIQEFLKQSGDLQFKSDQSKAEIYTWLSDLLIKIKYCSLKKKEKGEVKRFIRKVTGYSDRHLKRLLKRHKDRGLKWEKWQKNTWNRVYTNEDIALLHRVDEAHRISGKATKRILEREYEIFGNESYRKLKEISVAHIYNLRKRPSYLRLGKIFEETKSINVPIGIRMKPRPEGRPGFLRVDTVHQGDHEKAKGVYWINIVDEVTQMEFVFCVEAISEKYLIPVLKVLIKICPVKIINFHSDNGSEYINKVVAELLNELLIGQTKSRPRRHNDNALVETKNGSIVRKHFGYYHIPANAYNAHLLTTFCINYLNPYLTFHRPCGFATTTVDHRGREKKVYKEYATPYEKLKSLPSADQYLKPGVNFQELDSTAYQKSDTDFALEMQEAKAIMLQQLRLSTKVSRSHSTSKNALNQKYRPPISGPPPAPATFAP